MDRVEQVLRAEDKARGTVCEARERAARIESEAASAAAMILKTAERQAADESARILAESAARASEEAGAVSAESGRRIAALRTSAAKALPGAVSSIVAELVD